MEKVSSSSGVSLVGAARGKFVESLGEQRLKEMVHRTRHPNNVHHYQHLARQYWLELGHEAISGPGRPLYKELGNKTDQFVSKRRDKPSGMLRKI